MLTDFDVADVKLLDNESDGKGGLQSQQAPTNYQHGSRQIILTAMRLPTAIFLRAAA
jgi:hypothetical protein